MSNFYTLNDPMNKPSHKSRSIITTGTPVHNYDPQMQEPPTLAQGYQAISSNNCETSHINAECSISHETRANNVTSTSTRESILQENPDNVSAHKFGEIADPQQHFIKIKSRTPQQASCHNCQQCVKTRVEYHVGAGAFVSATCVAVMGGWMGCCLAPFFVKDCKDAVHFCPVCDTKLGVKKFIVN